MDRSHGFTMSRGLPSAHVWGNNIISKKPHHAELNIRTTEGNLGRRISWARFYLIIESSEYLLIPRCHINMRLIRSIPNKFRDTFSIFDPTKTCSISKVKRDWMKPSHFVSKKSDPTPWLVSYIPRNIPCENLKRPEITHILPPTSHICAHVQSNWDWQIIGSPWNLYYFWRRAKISQDIPPTYCSGNESKGKGTFHH